jgi:hypothetical protein
MPWQQSNFALATSDKLGLASSLGALSLAPAAPALAQWGQQWSQTPPWPHASGQPCAHAFGQAYSAWPASTGAPAVDMLVLPNSDACAVQSTDSKQDMVKVSYTTAQDLAEALFPTSAAANGDMGAQLERHSAHIEDLSEHRELVHEALLDHRDKVQELHATVKKVSDGMNLADMGLLDHKKHIRELKSSNSSTLQQLDGHAKRLSKIESDIKILSASGKSMDMGLKAHTKAFELQNNSLHTLATKQDAASKAHGKALELQNNSLHTLATKQDAVSKDVASLSQSLRSANPAQQDKDRQKQIRQLEKTMLETQAQLASLTSQAAMTNVTVNGPRVMRKA